MSQRHPATAAPGARTLSPRAISCITRPSSAGSIRTGWRTWLTIRSTGSCRSSNTFRLPENDLQLLASTFHPHLQRRNPRAGQLRHLLVFQVLDVLEEERLPVFRGEAAQRPADGVVPLGALGRTGERHTVQRRVVAHEQPRASRGPPARRAASVHEDAVEPRAESLGIVAARERAMRPDERVLQRFLRVLLVSEHVHGVAAEAITVPCDERAVRAGVARQDAAHQLSVARPHVLYTHRGSHNVTLPGGCDAGQGRRSILGRSYCARIPRWK